MGLLQTLNTYRVSTPLSINMLLVTYIEVHNTWIGFL